MSDHAPHAVHDDHPDDGSVHAHISTASFLVAIFAALVVLTIATVGASYVNFGSGNTVIAVVIATMKASLVAVFFMHLRHDKPFHSFTFVMAFVFLGIFLLLTTDDMNTRGMVDSASGTHVLPRTGLQAPGGLANEYDSRGGVLLTPMRVGPEHPEHAAEAHH